MTNDIGLVLLLLIPAGGALLGALLPASAARTWALLVSLATFFVAAYIGIQFHYHPDQATAFSALQIDYPSSASTISFSFSLGMDWVSYWLVALTAFLTPLAIAASFASIEHRTREYYSWMLLLLAAMIGVFIARDLLVFYVFFELTLVPMFFIIGIWGGPERRMAAGKFFLFTFTGSVLTLAGAIYLGIHARTFDIHSVIWYAQNELTSYERKWLLLAFLAGFAVKVPLFPVHTWLPLAHAEAPTAGSVILAGVLLKLGTYGLFRLAVPIGLLDAGLNVTFPLALHIIGQLCIIGIIYGALVAWVQTDIKKLVAYSSVSHLGFCVLGLVALNVHGIEGSILYMINHGLSTGAMFLVIGMIYERFHTRDIDQLSGLAKRMPILAFFFIFFTLSSIALPGLNGFVSEFLTILGAFTSDHLGSRYGALAALGIILGAVYMLHLSAKVIWGPLKFPGGHGDAQGHGHGHVEPAAKADIGGREIAILVPIAIAVVWLGVYPTGLLNSLDKSARELVRPESPAAAMTTNMAAAPVAAPAPAAQ